MKTLNSLLALSAITLLLTVTPALRAGPSPQYWNQRATANQSTPAAAVTVKSPATPVCTACQSCSTCTAAAKAKA